MENNNTIMTPVQKGLYIGLGLVVISLATYLLMPDMAQQNKVGWVTYVVIIGAIIWACLKYAKDVNGNTTFGNIFAHGFKTTAVMTVIVLIYTILALTVLFPEMKDKALEVARTQMEERGGISDEQIDQALEMTKKFFVPFAIGGVLIGYLIIGAIGSLLGAAFAKKNPQPQAFQ